MVKVDRIRLLRRLCTSRSTPNGDFLQVLLVEDDPVNQRIMAKLLKKIGFNADVVGNGIEAIGALQSRSYDVIFMDVQMPQMDGLQATKAIRDRWPCKSIRIIALTSCSLKGDREKCLLAGMDDYIAKPAKEEDILASLSRYR